MPFYDIEKEEGLFKMKNRFLAKRFVKNDRGATAVEYGLLIAGIAIAIVIIVFTMGDSLEGQFTDYSAKVSARP